MRVVQAVLFDLDGTLLDTLADIADCMNRALGELGLPQHPYDAYRYFVGSGAKMLANRAVGEDNKGFAEQAEALYSREYAQFNAVKTQPYPGIQGMLSQIRDLHLPMAVLSNKPHQNTLSVVAHYFPEGIFSMVRGQMEYIPLKPDPAAALTIASCLKVNPERILYAGDTAVDMACANAAGMVSVGVTWGFRTRSELVNAGARYLADTPEDIMALLERV